MIQPAVSLSMGHPFPVFDFVGVDGTSRMVLSLRNCTSDFVGAAMWCLTSTCRATSPISSSSVGAVKCVLQTGLPQRNSYIQSSLHRFAEVADGLQARVDRGHDLRH